jgi:hypothetical protein
MSEGGHGAKESEFRNIRSMFTRIVTALCIFAALGLVGWAVVIKEVTSVQAALLLFVGLLLLICIQELISSIGTEPPEIVSNWGGLGGGLGGWRMSRSLALLLVTIVLAGILYGLATADLRHRSVAVSPSSSTTKSAGDATTPAAPGAKTAGADKASPPQKDAAPTVQSQKDAK